MSTYTTSTFGFAGIPAAPAIEMSARDYAWSASPSAVRVHAMPSLRVHGAADVHVADVWAAKQGYPTPRGGPA